jgi:hypothetical protein
MIPAEVIAQMASLGLDGAQAAAVAAMLSAVEVATIREAMQPFEAEKARVAEEEAARLANKRQTDRERQRRHRMSRVTDRDNALSRVTPPLPDKEKSPTPPKEIHPTHLSPSLRSGLVDEPVDARPPSKKIERTESDQKLLDAITDVWNAWAIGHHCPQVKFLTDERARRCRSRLRDIANGEEPVPAFRKVLSKCETSFFIRGSPRGPLTFDHLMREGFLSKMLEGGYEHEGKNQWRK